MLVFWCPIFELFEAFEPILTQKWTFHWRLSDFEQKKEKTETVRFWGISEKHAYAITWQNISFTYFFGPFKLSPVISISEKMCKDMLWNCLQLFFATFLRSYLGSECWRCRVKHAIQSLDTKQYSWTLENRLIRLSNYFHKRLKT